MADKLPVERMLLNNVYVEPPKNGSKIAALIFTFSDPVEKVEHSMGVQLIPGLTPAQIGSKLKVLATHIENGDIPPEAKVLPLANRVDGNETRN